MARGLWKGAISFGLVNVPVELFAAQKRTSELDLTMLDKRDLAPVGYKRYNKASGEDVPWAEIVKGYEYEDGKYVVLSEEDFRRANVEASRTVEIVAFVERDAVPPKFFRTPYYLAPGKRGEKAYALLRETLHKAGKIGYADQPRRFRIVATGAEISVRKCHFRGVGRTHPGQAKVKPVLAVKRGSGTGYAFRRVRLQPGELRPLLACIEAGAGAPIERRVLRTSPDFLHQARRARIEPEQRRSNRAPLIVDQPCAVALPCDGNRRDARLKIRHARRKTA